MLFNFIIFLLTIIFLIFFIIKKPYIIIKTKKIQTFYFAPVIGAICLLITQKGLAQSFIQQITTNNAVNPIKILVLFLCVSFLSVVIDYLNFFDFIANWCANRFQKSQFHLFFTFYILIAILTIFTSNDIIILTFTPIICLFSKKMKIDPIPYLIMEFVTANTYSMLLVIGNPTNIYLTNFFHISFMEYISNMLIPTMVAGMVSLCLLLMLFYKKLKTPLKINYQEEIKIQHKGLLIVALIHLGICLFSLCIANLLKIEMYLLCLIVASSLCLILILVSLFTKKNHIKSCLLKLPYNLIPFLLSMFVLVLSLKEVNVFTSLATYYNKINNKYVLRYQYGFGSLFSANVLNNIPMTLAYSFIMENTNISSFSSTIYPCIVASNIGAYLTPIGSLAGIMWLDILKNKDIHYGFKEFIKYGFIFAPLTLFVTLLFF